MNSFKKFFVWGMNIKLYASIYTLAILFFYGVILAFSGVHEISLLTLLIVFISQFVVAILQNTLLNETTDYSKSVFFTRSIIWVLTSTAITLSTSILFNWYKNQSIILNIVLAVLMFIGYFMMLFGIKIEKEQNTIRLNTDLKKFQNQNQPNI